MKLSMSGRRDIPRRSVLALVIARSIDREGADDREHLDAAARASVWARGNQLHNARQVRRAVLRDEDRAHAGDELDVEGTITQAGDCRRAVSDTRTADHVFVRAIPADAAEDRSAVDLANNRAREIEVTTAPNLPNRRVEVAGSAAELTCRRRTGSRCKG